MREIKFRAWIRCGEWDDNDEKQAFKMVAADELFIADHSPLCELLVDVDDECYFMQFTGLHDKNGKEIYEGDIIREEILPPDDPAHGYYGDVAEVIWHSKGAVGWALKSGERIRFLISSDNHLYEIIGNIHENPELLDLP